MIEQNLAAVRERIAGACAKAGRDPVSVTIVAVSKGRRVEQISEALAAGITDIGENRVQEAISKYNDLRAKSQESRVKWHLVGHLQTNKVKEAVKHFGLIQSVDTLSLAEEIDKQAARINKVQDILVEVKTSPELTKFGVRPQEATKFLTEVVKLKNIRIRGLMTIAPLVSNPQEARPYFRMLRELRDKINSLQLTMLSSLQLSMGMTDDFEVAIEEGADMIRLGRAIYE